jgi:hypothetical protein
MFLGAHILLYSDQPEEDRAFLRDVLEFPAIDIGHGWLIFKMPSAEAALHPSSGDNSQAHGGRRLLGASLYLMCDDLPALMKKLEAKNVSFSPPEEEDWGIKTTIKLPSGGELGLYQPTHPTALNLKT